MPVRAKKPCRRWGCAELVSGAGGYCAEHAVVRGREVEGRRMSSSKRGYDGKWRGARLSYLGKNPLCVACLSRGLVTAGTDVDHIVPHRGDRQLFWDIANWQTLCHSCHSTKTAKGL